MNKLPTQARAQIIHLLCEGNSIRAVTRLTGASKNTVIKLLIDAGKACADYQDKALRDLPCKRIQVDEIWSFIYAKQKNIHLIHDTPLGKAYVLGMFLTREVTDMGFKVASRVRGLSDEAFREAFGAEEQCRSALSRLRWPDGFVCPACGHRGHCVLAGRSLYQCYRCKKQTSSTAGTIFHATKLPLTLWFAAVHLIVTAKNGISSVELGRRLGVKQPTAWTMKHKIMAVMARREADTPLSGRVEMDDAYLGGARAGGKRGRGAPGKTPFVAAVSTSPEGRPRKVKLVPVKGFRKREIARGAKRWLAPGSEVLTDGLRCWNALDGVVGSHRAIRTGSGRQAALQMGQHEARQHQERDHRNLPQARPRSCPTLPRQLRLAIQPALPAQHHDPALRSQRRTNPTHPIPGAHRWMTFMDKQEEHCSR